MPRSLTLSAAGALLAMLAVSLPLTAQLPAVGSRVRVRAPCPAGFACDRLIGQVLELTTETITVLVPGGAPQPIPLASVISIDVSRGRRGHAPIGAAIGVLVGVVAVTASDCKDNIATECDAQAPLGLVLFGGLGAFVGHMIKSERWERVRPATALMQPIPGGIRLGLRMALE